jgi:hypothetical protein
VLICRGWPAAHDEPGDLVIQHIQLVAVQAASIASLTTYFMNVRRVHAASALSSDLSSPSGVQVRRTSAAGLLRMMTAGGSVGFESLCAAYAACWCVRVLILTGDIQEPVRYHQQLCSIMQLSKHTSGMRTPISSAPRGRSCVCNTSTRQAQQARSLLSIVQQQQPAMVAAAAQQRNLVVAVDHTEGEQQGRLP